MASSGDDRFAAQGQPRATSHGPPRDTETQPRSVVPEIDDFQQDGTGIGQQGEQTGMCPIRLLSRVRSRFERSHSAESARVVGISF